MNPDLTVDAVELIGPGDAQFSLALAALLGHEPDRILRPALPWSVIARNNADQTVALLGARFDMRSAAGKTYSVVHYADSLRYPDKADLTPGALRFICAEPLYTRMVLHRENDIDPRGPLNLANLRKSVGVRASVDCIAFADGRFCGPDSLNAFDRLANERAAEQQLLAAVLIQTSPEQELKAAMEQPGLRALARKLYDAFLAGGRPELLARASRHRCRIALWRA